MRNELIDRILAAARKPCPEITECFELLGTDGKWRSGLGFPLGVRSTGERRSVGFAYRDSRSGCMYGVRGKSVEELRLRHSTGQDRAMAEFRAILEDATDEAFESQVKYWIGLSPAGWQKMPLDCVHGRLA